MRRVYRFWKIVLVDTLGVLLMLAALATGWLPGPGGIPLFLIGLSLVASNHDWAQKYIDWLRDYADRLGDLVFVKNKAVQLAYDLLSPLLVGAGAVLIMRRSALWMVSAGISTICLGLLVFFGNRDRWKRFKNNLKRKH